jgi:hypothetical protein
VEEEAEADEEKEMDEDEDEDQEAEAEEQGQEEEAEDEDEEEEEEVSSSDGLQTSDSGISSLERGGSRRALDFVEDLYFRTFGELDDDQQSTAGILSSKFNSILDDTEEAEDAEIVATEGIISTVIKEWSSHISDDHSSSYVLSSMDNTSGDDKNDQDVANNLTPLRQYHNQLQEIDDDWKSDNFSPTSHSDNSFLPLNLLNCSYGSNSIHTGSHCLGFDLEEGLQKE